MDFLPTRWAKPEELERFKQLCPDVEFPSLERGKSDPPLVAPHSFFPFSGGARKCLGQIVARYEAQLVCIAWLFPGLFCVTLPLYVFFSNLQILAKFFDTFNIEQVNKGKPVISRFEGTLAPENFYARFSLRN